MNQFHSIIQGVEPSIKKKKKKKDKERDKEKETQIALQVMKN